jgi:hypothetical protein
MAYLGNPLVTATFLTDSFSGNGSTTGFTLTVSPANTASILVIISGVTQDPSTYSINGTTLNFSAAPPSGTNNISVRYLGIPANAISNTATRTVTEFTATSGQTTFTVSSYTVGYVNVYRNGVRLGEADFTATNGTQIVLQTGATTGDLVTVESFRVESLNATSAVNAQYVDNQNTHVIYYNGQTVTTDVTIASNRNAFSAGPISIEVGHAVTIENGGTWIIL